MVEKTGTSQEESKENTEEKLEETLYDGDKGKEEPKKEEAAPEKKEEEPKKEEPKKEEPKKEEGKEEVKFELKLPKGSMLNADAVERIVSFAKEQGLSPKHAQALLDRESNLLVEHAENQKKTFDALSNEWVEQAKADKEFGGEKLGENAELAKRVVARFGSKELIQGLETTKFGNHPELIRMLVRIGKSMSEDQLVLPGKSTAAKKDMADIFYGGQNDNKKE